ncbi:MAG: hypothetical protein AB1697_00090 [Pseudomonadota bacterium]
MRYPIQSLLAAAFCLSAAGAQAGTDQAAGAPLQLAQSANAACVQKCEEQKQRCFDQYKKSDSVSGSYITPEGHKLCWSAYHECKRNCPR